MKNLEKMVIVPLAAVVIATASGCTTTQKGAGLGALAGAALGGMIGHQSGHGGEGAAIGAGVGAVSGALLGEQMDKKYCPKCGTEYTSGVTYCSKDGTELQYKK